MGGGAAGTYAEPQGPDASAERCAARTLTRLVRAAIAFTPASPDATEHGVYLPAEPHMTHHILIVDDQPDLAGMIANMLTDAGYTTRIATG